MPQLMRLPWFRWLVPTCQPVLYSRLLNLALPSLRWCCRSSSHSSSRRKPSGRRGPVTAQGSQAAAFYSAHEELLLQLRL